MQRDLSRKEFQSKNWYQAKLKVQRAHRKIADIRQDIIHHLTSYLAKNHSEIILEDLNVKGLMKNRHLSKALSDVAFGTIRTQTEYKCERYSSRLILADRFFPSSQLCSECGHRQKMPLSVRIYDCQNCGSKKDRDFNASLNLENYEACLDSVAYEGDPQDRTESLVAGSVTSRFVDEVLPSVSDEASDKHQCQDLSCVV